MDSETILSGSISREIFKGMSGVHITKVKYLPQK